MKKHIKNVFILFFSTLFVFTNYPLFGQDAEPEGDIIVSEEEFSLDDKKPAETSGSGKKMRALKIIGIVVGFAATTTLGLILSSTNTGKSPKKSSS